MNTMAHQLLQQDCIETYELYLDDVRGLAALAGETGEDQRKEFYHTCEGKSRILTAKAIPLKDGSRNVIVLLLPFVQVQEDILQSSSAEIPALLSTATRSHLRMPSFIRSSSPAP